jgi:hypothetical protein
LLHAIQVEPHVVGIILARDQREHGIHLRSERAVPAKVPQRRFLVRFPCLFGHVMQGEHGCARERLQPAERLSEPLHIADVVFVHIGQVRETVEDDEVGAFAFLRQQLEVCRFGDVALAVPCDLDRALRHSACRLERSAQPLLEGAARAFLLDNDNAQAGSATPQRRRDDLCAEVERQERLAGIRRSDDHARRLDLHEVEVQPFRQGEVASHEVLEPFEAPAFRLLRALRQLPRQFLIDGRSAWCARAFTRDLRGLADDLRSGHYLDPGPHRFDVRGHRASIPCKPV